MKDGFVKVKAISPNIVVGDVEFNTKSIISEIEQAIDEKINVILFPELSLTGFTCLDFFFFDDILTNAITGLVEICSYTKSSDIIVVIGLPMKRLEKIYNVAAVIQGGQILGIVPKKNLPNYLSFSEKRYFTSGSEIKKDETISLLKTGEKIPFSPNLIFKSRTMGEFSFGVELCEDLWAPIPPSSYLALGGASLILNLSASPEIIGKSNQRINYISTLSSRLLSAYVYANAGMCESNAEFIYSGHCIISECGEILAENKPFSSDSGCISEIDLKKISYLRSINTSFETDPDDFTFVYFNHSVYETNISRKIYKNPFRKDREKFSRSTFEAIVNIQSSALARRISNGNYNSVKIVADGTTNDILTLYCIIRAFRLIYKSLDHISLCNCNVNYSPLLENYNNDISDLQNEKVLYVYGYNLNDWAFKKNTVQNEDNYFLNSSLPRSIVEGCVAIIKDEDIFLNNIDMTQYSFEDTTDVFMEFILYYNLKFGFSVAKIYRLAKIAYGDIFDNNTICDLMKSFYSDFWSHQKYRSNLSDSVQIGSVSLSPKSNFKMNSDLSPDPWIKSIEKLYIY